MENKLATSPTSKKQYKTWVKSSRNNEWTKEIRVEEIENGFLVCLDEYGERKGKYPLLIYPQRIQYFEKTYIFNMRNHRILNRLFTRKKRQYSCNNKNNQ